MSTPSLDHIFEQFDNLKVLIIGDVMVDSYIWGKVERISPEAPVPVVRTTKKDFRLGGAANVALNIQAMGAKPILCALIGTDNDGDRFMQRLDERKISSEGIHKSGNRPTTVKTRVISDNQHIVRIDEESNSNLSSSEQASLLGSIEKFLPSCDVVIFEDYDKGCINAEIINKTVAIAKKHNIPTVVDPKRHNFLDYKGVSLFKPNLKELKEGLKIDVEVTDKAQLQKAVQELKQVLDCEGVFVTLSEHGVYIDQSGEQHHIPAHLREIADVSGAGDTVISIAALCVASQLSPYHIATLSNLGGGLVCEHVGVVTIDKNNLLHEAKDFEF